MITITPVYAAIAALFFVYLSMRVIGYRRLEKINLGDAGNSQMRKRIRVHGNFAEYVPFTILIMALAELQGAAAWLLHLLGLALLAARLIHAYGVSHSPQIIKYRVYGTVLSFIVIITAALTCLALSFMAVFSGP